MSSQNLTSIQHQFAGWEQAQEYYVEANLTDGLPIVPPSEVGYAPCWNLPG